jgi:hypothetical protein
MSALVEVTFDPVMFHGVAGEWAMNVEPFTEADPVGVLLSTLVGFGSAVGKSAHVQVGPTLHHCNEYGLLVGPTAVGRKGEAMTAGLRPVLKGDSEWGKRVKRGFGSGEAIVAYLSDDPREKSEGSEVSDPRVLVQEGEFAQLMSVAARDGSTMSSLLRAGWDGVPLENHTRKHGDLEAPDAHLSVLAGVTKVELVERVTATEIANGFLNRFLLVNVHRTKMLPEPQPIPPKLDDATAKWLHRALLHARQFGPDLRRDSKASERWYEAYETELSVERYGLAGAVCSRAEAHTLRLSMLYALLDCSKVIGVEHVEAALAMWRFCEQSAIDIFGEDSGDPDREKLLGALTEAGAQGMARQEISQLFQGHRSKQQLDVLLDRADEQLLIASKDEPTAGRPRKRYWLAEFDPDRVSF